MIQDARPHEPVEEGAAALGRVAATCDDWNREVVSQETEMAVQVNQAVAKYGLKLERATVQYSDRERTRGRRWLVIRHGRKLVNPEAAVGANEQQHCFFFSDACELAHRIAYIARSWESWDRMWAEVEA